MERNEYLQRPLIEDVVYEISDNMVLVTSPHTSYICVKKEKQILLSETRKLFQKLKKEAKDSGKMKIKGVSKFLPTVKSLYPDYCAGFEQINKKFSEIVEIVHKIQSDGLHLGCLDDELLNAALKKQSEIEKFHYRNSPYSQYLECHRSVQANLAAKQWENSNMISSVISLI